MLLRLIAVEQLTPYPFTVLGWSVEDIATTVAGLTAGGVVFERIEGVEQDDLGVWLLPRRRPRRLVQGPRRQHAVAHAVLICLSSPA